jgi:hypothetical protein
MKHTFLFTLSILFILTSCNSDFSSKTIQGKWQVTEMNADMPELSPAVIKSGQDLALTTEYFFNADSSSLETSSFYPDGIPGRWIFDQDSMSLSINSVDEAIPSNANYDVIFESSKKMTLTQNYPDLGSLTMTLIKVKN